MRHREGDIFKKAKGSSSGVSPERWVDDHGDCLYRYALPRIRRPEVAEDLVQETFCTGRLYLWQFPAEVVRAKLALRNLKNNLCDYFRRLDREMCFTDLEFLEDEISHKFIDQ